VDRVGLGKTGLRLSPVGLGTWQWGAPEWGWGGGYGEAEVAAAFERSLALGVNWVDTAEIYGMGRSEEMVGRLLKQHKGEEIFVASKVAPFHDFERACENSRRRLGVDAIDLYQIHFPSVRYTVPQMMRAMARLRKRGWVRHIGVSNFNLRRMRTAAASLPEGEVVSNQVQYNLLERGPERNLLPHLRENGQTLIAYSPLAKGAVSGKYGPDNPPKDLARKMDAYFSPENLRKISPLVQVLREVGAARGKSSGQVALNWLLGRGPVVAIPGAKSAAQAEENAGAMGWRLTADETRRVDGALQGVVIRESPARRLKAVVTMLRIGAANLLNR
jgi:aryl-alcohol dehydrogenase-like predicted oxidoreductase